MKYSNIKYIKFDCKTLWTWSIVMNYVETFESDIKLHKFHHSLFTEMLLKEICYE